MKTDIYTPDRRKSPRKMEYISGQCLEKAGLIIPHGAIANQCQIYSEAVYEN